MKKGLLLLIAIGLLAVGGIVFFSWSDTSGDKNTITFGATAGDFSDIVTESLKPQLEAEGYQVRLVQFTDYVQPNIALAEGRLHANIFQHKPYLEQFIAQKGLKLTPKTLLRTRSMRILSSWKVHSSLGRHRMRITQSSTPTMS
jgi:D-methionine transport system substrate-binding protein